MARARVAEFWRSAPHVVAVEDYDERAVRRHRRGAVEQQLAICLSKGFFMVFGLMPNVLLEEC